MNDEKKILMAFGFICGKIWKKKKILNVNISFKIFNYVAKKMTL